MKRLLSWTLMALVAFTITATADLLVRDGNNPPVTQKIFNFVCFSTKLCNATVLIKSDGAEVGTASAPLRTDPTGTTPQPITGTVTANLGGLDLSGPSLPVSGTFWPYTLGQQVAASSVPVVLTSAQLATLTPPAAITGFSTSTKQSDGSQKTQIVDSSGNVIASTSNALNVNITGGAAAGGTSSNFAASFPSAGTAAGMSQGGNMVAMTGTSGNLNVQCANCSGSGVSTADAATFTASSSLFAGTGGFFQTTATANPLTNGQQGMLQMTANRAAFTNLRNASGAELGVAAAPLQVSLANTAANATAVKVDGSAVTQPVSGTFWQATQPVSGTVTANFGTIAGVATETTLSALNTKTPALGQALAAGSVPVILPSATITTLTPPAAITGFATQTTLASMLTNLGSPFQAGGSIGNTSFAATQATAANLNATVVGTGTFPVQATIATPSAWGINTLGSTTSGQSGQLALGAVTTAAPSYTTAQSNAFSLTPAGALRVDGSGVTQPVSQSGTWTVQPGNTANTTAWLVTGTGGTFPATQSGNWTSRMVGNAGGLLDAIGQNVAAPANWLQAGCQFQTSPTTISAGNGSPFQCNNGGKLLTSDTVSQGYLATVAAAAVGANPVNVNTVVTAQTGLTPGVAQTGTIVAANTDTSSIKGTATAVNSGNKDAGTQRIILATDSVALPAWGHGATGSAAPAGAAYVGANSSGNLVGIIQADTSIKIDMSTNTVTQLIALSSGKKIYVTAWDVMAAGTTNFKLVYGTGTNCGTGTTDVTALYNLTAQAGLSKGSGLGPVLVIPASQALCASNSAAIQASGSLAFTQF